MEALNRFAATDGLGAARAVAWGWWHRYGDKVIAACAVFMLAVAAIRMADAVPRFTWEPGLPGDSDVKLRHAEIQRWFSGQQLYGAVSNGDYPPASYAMLWPLLGWLEIDAARWLWTATSLAALFWLSLLCVKGSKAGTPLEVAAVVLLVFSMYSTSGTIWVGQLGNHILPLLLSALLLLHCGRGGWPRDALAAAILLFTLIKPTVSAPFFLLLVFYRFRALPLLLIGAGYASLTFLAASFQAPDTVQLLAEWMSQARGEVDFRYGHINIHKVLSVMGLERFNFYASMLVAAAAAAWIYCHRRADFWLVVGVTALVARLWAHHRMHDDLLVLLPMVALARSLKQGRVSDRRAAAAVFLLLASWASLVLPMPTRLPIPSAVYTANEIAQALVWGALLVFLMAQARRGRKPADPARGQMVDTLEADHLVARYGKIPYHGSALQNFLAEICAVMRRHAGLRRDSRFLDIGCGRGNLLKYLRDSGHSRLAGIEPCEQLARGAVFDGIRAGSFEDNDCADGSFDVVCTCHTLHHVKDRHPDWAIREMLRIARHYVVIVEINNTNLPMLLFALWNMKAEANAWRYNLRKVKRLVAGAGARSVYQGNMESCYISGDSLPYRVLHLIGSRAYNITVIAKGQRGAGGADD